jgi:hypothetical protein
MTLLTIIAGILIFTAGIVLTLGIAAVTGWHSGAFVVLCFACTVMIGLAALLPLFVK